MIDETVSLKMLFHTPLFFLLLTTLVILLPRLGLLSHHAARTPIAERRGESKVDVLLRVETNDERRDVDDLLADTAECGQSSEMMLL